MKLSFVLRMFALALLLGLTGAVVGLAVVGVLWFFASTIIALFHTLNTYVDRSTAALLSTFICVGFISGICAFLSVVDADGHINWFKKK